MAAEPIESPSNGPERTAAERHGAGAPFDTRMADLKRRLLREATMAIQMLEKSINILWALDHDRAAELRRDDDRVDREEIAIEQECREILALYSPVARQFRSITFVLKVNADLERVADHACSIAKVATRLDGSVAWPTALRDMATRVPGMCHELLRVILDEDVEAAQSLVRGDNIIDGIDHQLFDEIVTNMVRTGGVEASANGLLLYRAGRELERVGDLVANIAEEVVFLVTGDMIRHQS
ncbi:MAG: phosphate signaling complex protein PhoU [Planctomycetota bacterium]